MFCIFQQTSTPKKNVGHRRYSNPSMIKGSLFLLDGDSIIVSLDDQIANFNNNNSSGSSNFNANNNTGANGSRRQRRENQ
jgi:hypothetical protein